MNILPGIKNNVQYRKFDPSGFEHMIVWINTVIFGKTMDLYIYIWGNLDPRSINWWKFGPKMD